MNWRLLGGLITSCLIFLLYIRLTTRVRARWQAGRRAELTAQGIGYYTPGARRCLSPAMRRRFDLLHAVDAVVVLLFLAALVGFILSYSAR